MPLLEKANIAGANAIVQALIDECMESSRGVEGLILGCTHYTLLTEKLREAYGSKLKIFSQTEIIPEKLDDYLMRHSEIETTLSRGGKRNVFLTEHREDYDKHISLLLEGQFLAE